MEGLFFLWCRLWIRKYGPHILQTSFERCEVSEIPLLEERMKKPKRKLTAAEKRARRERRAKFMTIFINGKQKRVPRPQLIDGLPVDEFIARNADPIWLHENGLWELHDSSDEC